MLVLAGALTAPLLLGAAVISPANDPQNPVNTRPAEPTRDPERTPAPSDPVAPAPEPEPGTPSQSTAPTGPNASIVPTVPSRTEEAEIRSWLTEARLVENESGGIDMHVVETVVLSSADGTAGNGFLHAIGLTPLADPTTELNRITEVKVTVDDDTTLAPVANITIGQPDVDGLVPFFFDVVDNRPDLTEATYQLSYTVHDPFVEFAPDQPLELAFSLGPMYHSATIDSYQATVSVADSLVHRLIDVPMCAVIRPDMAGTCVMEGDLAQLRLRADTATLAEDEWLLFGLVLEPAQGEAPPPTAAPPSEEAEAQPEAETGARTLDAPEWTRYAAGVGIVALGAGALWLTNRRQRHELGAE